MMDVYQTLIEEVRELKERVKKLEELHKPETDDEIFEEAKKIVLQYDRASASLLQRRLSIGYARAARLLDQLEAKGVVGPGNGAEPRKVLIKK